MSTDPTHPKPRRTKTLDLRTRCDMRHEQVRHQLGKVLRTGAPLTDREHLAMHRESFLAGARAMAGAVADELAALERNEEEARAAAGEKVVPFPIPGSEWRFTHWPTAHRGVPTPHQSEPKKTT